MIDESTNEIALWKELASTAGSYGTHMGFGAAMGHIEVILMSYTNMMSLPNCALQTDAWTDVNHEATHGIFSCI